MPTVTQTTVKLIKFLKLSFSSIYILGFPSGKVHLPGKGKKFKNWNPHHPYKLSESFMS